MDILKKIDESINYQTEARGIKSAQDLMSSVKREVRKRLGESFFKAAFDKTSHGDGIAFFKASKCSFKEATNETLEESTHLIIAVEGFDDQGGLCQECGEFVVETVKYKGGNKILRRRKTNDIQKVKEAIVKYFEKYEADFRLSEATTSGAVGTAAVANVNNGQGTQYIPNGSGTEGSSRTVGSIAVNATRNGLQPQRRDGKKKKKHNQ